MPRKKYDSDSDPELEKAQNDPNAIIHWNCDGSYSIDYIEPDDPESQLKEQDMSINIARTFIHLKRYCKEKMYPFLDMAEVNDFYEFLY